MMKLVTYRALNTSGMISFLSEYLSVCKSVSFIGRMIHVGVRVEDRLGRSGREDVFTDDPDHVSFSTGGI
jgi:hypothetical protein